MVLLPLLLFAQAAAPTFDVASVRACRDEDRRAQMPSRPGNMRLVCWPLRRLIQGAYDFFSTGAVNPLNPAYIPQLPLENLPAWADTTSYTVLAKSSNNESLAMMRGPMMQRLLEDRFQLKLKRQTREVPVYLLTVAKPGKLTPTRAGSCRPLDPTGQTQSLKPVPNELPLCIITPPSKQESVWTWDVKGMGLPLFASMLQPGLPVVDRTGLEGAFDIRLEWGADPDLPGGTLMDAVRQQLGLRFDKGRAPREFLVIEHIQKPSEN